MVYLFNGNEKRADFRSVPAVILAGGEGKRLFPLTCNRAKPAVRFGGNFRIIDFALSNCYNSGIRKILLLTQYKALSLDRHIAAGWGPLFCRAGGDFVDVLPPQQRISTDWYQGTANAVYQNIYALEMESPSDVLILSGDHIYRMDYGKLLAKHRETGADMTIAAISLSANEARRRFGVLAADITGRVTGFEEKPENPVQSPPGSGQVLASMGIYLFKAGFLFEALCRDAIRFDSRHDFGNNIIPRLLQSARVYAAVFTAEGEDRLYWRDVGTLESYYAANQDLLGNQPAMDLFDERWPIRTAAAAACPARYTADSEIRESLVSAGSRINGAVLHKSIIGPACRIGAGSCIDGSILFPDVRIGKNVQLRRVILDRGCTVPDGEKIGFQPEEDRRRGFYVSESGLTVVSQPSMTFRP